MPWILAINPMSGALTVGALAAGVWAAVLCRHASRVPIDPGWSALDRPVLPELEQLGWNAAFLRAASTAGQLNGRAVHWTIWSVILSAVAGLSTLSTTLMS